MVNTAKLYNSESLQYAEVIFCVTDTMLPLTATTFFFQYFC